MPLYRKGHNLLAVITAGQTIVFNAVNDVAKFAQRDGRAIAVSDDQLAIFFRVRELAIRLDSEVLMNAIERSDRQICITALQSSCDIVDADATAG